MTRWCYWLSTRGWKTANLHHCCGGVPDYPLEAEKLVFSPLGETGKVLVLTIVLHGWVGISSYPPQAGEPFLLPQCFMGVCDVPGYPTKAWELLLSP
jgi:hypothetical protein